MTHSQIGFFSVSSNTVTASFVLTSLNNKEAAFRECMALVEDAKDLIECDNKYESQINKELRLGRASFSLRLRLRLFVGIIDWIISSAIDGELSLETMVSMQFD